MNRAIQDGAAPLEAWFWKSRFLTSVGYNRSAAEMIEAALNRYDNAPSRVELLEETAFLWAECGRGDDALRAADTAVALGSNSVRTLYLRGRALALIGSIDDARVMILQVLALDPKNSDAHRALKMIDSALGPSVRKPWWKVW